MFKQGEEECGICDCITMYEFYRTLFCTVLSESHLAGFVEGGSQGERGGEK